MKQSNVCLLLLFQFFLVELSRAACRPSDESALHALAASYSSDDTSAFDSWGEGDCCTWPGVTCSNVSSSTAAVTELSLLNLGLVGSAQPTPICNLTALRRLEIPSGPLLGPLMPCLVNLRQLRYLDLSANLITSIAPSSLAQLSDLQALYLHDNLIEDTISFISTALPSNLSTLDLNSNFFIKGSIPASLFDQRPSLQDLDLSYNSLSGALPTLMISPNSTSSSLQTLILSHNNLSGAIPPSIFTHLRSLRTLDLSNNFLTDALPDSMYALAHLQSVDLSTNSLTGSISPSIHNLQSLQSLVLNSNHLSGAVPPALASLSNLSSLDLSSNDLDPAPFPPFLGNLSKLVSLSLSYNNFNSSIPPEWQNISTLLSELSLSGNALSSAHALSSAPSFPSWLFRRPLSYLELSSLQIPSASFACDVFRFVNSTISYLDLSVNNLNAAALLNDCLSLVSFPFLSWLNLSHNPLHSASLISSSKLRTPRLEILDLGSCGLQGSIPDNFVPNSIYTLDLSDNKFTGKLPAGFGNFSKIEDMDLSHNYFTSSKLPNISGGLILTLLLSYNEFTGELGRFLGNFGNTENTITQGRPWKFLDVSFNQLTGMIPPYLANCSNLERIKMGNNLLNGTIPPELSSLENLTTLSLHGNMLVGTIPSTLFNCSSLQVLDLRQNALHGQLEDAFFSSTSYNLSALRVLLLGYNQLGGAVPPSLGMSSPDLQLLDLSNNQFNGSIPPHLHFPGFISTSQQRQSAKTLATEGTLFEDDISIHAKGLNIEYTYILNVLTSLDLSGNSFSGTIPPTFGDLTGLMYLNLSRNRLTGSIPVELSKLGNLESLDLSFNNLTGTIPTELKDISSLEVFNVSFNEELHGAIPAGAVQLTDPNSYVGDSQLCGSPLRSCPEYVQNDSPQANPQEEDESKAGALHWMEEWLSIPGTLLGLSVGYICTLCVLHVKLNGTSLFERLFNLLKGKITG